MQGITQYPDKRRNFGKLFEHPRGDKLHVYQDKLLFSRGSRDTMDVWMRLGMVAEVLVPDLLPLLDSAVTM